MAENVRQLAFATAALLLAGVPWLVTSNPGWVPAMAVVAVLLWRQGRATAKAVQFASPAVIAVSSLAALIAAAGWLVAGGWLVAAVIPAVTGIGFASFRGRSTPDALDGVALGLWSVPFVVQPDLIGTLGVAWLAPLLLLLASAQLGRLLAVPRSVCAGGSPAPPSRDVRGTLTLDGVVIGLAGAPRSVPIDLELRAGDSVAILCEDRELAEALIGVLVGRSKPLQGDVLIDGEPLVSTDRLVAEVRPGALFFNGDLDLNLGALCDPEPEPEVLTVVQEACGLADVVTALAGRNLAADGSPLRVVHRLLVLAARVVPSTYRVMAVLDPELWINEVEGELWRRAVVRASVGRTALWVTGDRHLAERATRVFTLRHGALRPAPTVRGESC